LVGDFNFSHIDWSSVQGNSSSCFTCNRFVDVLQKNFLTQHVQSATRARGTDTPHLLDLVITDTPDIIQDITIHGPLGKSDHAILKIKCKLDTQTVDNCIGKLNYGKGDYEKLRKSLDIDWAQVFGDFDNDVDKKWDYLKSSLISGIQNYIPTISDFQQWKKPSWKCPLDEKV